MKNSIKTILLTALLLVNAGLIFSQQTRIELGDKYFDQQAFEKAIPLYEGAIKNGHTNKHTYAKLGDSYYYTSQPDSAVSSYKNAFKPNDESRLYKKHRLRYALCLLSVGQEEENKVHKDSAIAKFSKIYEIDIDSLKIENFTKAGILVKNIESINTKYSDFGAYIFNDTLYFASSREKEKKRKPDNRKYNKRLYKWNDNPFLEIYSAAIERNDSSDIFRLIQPDSSNIGFNTFAHESSIAIMNDSTMYFSGGLVNKKNKLVYNKRGVSNLKLQLARRNSINNKWVLDDSPKTIEDLDFLNLENYSIGNPALNHKKDTLFFVSCAPYPEAKGQSDIYFVVIDEKGKLGDVNSVPIINTNGRESFPFISSNGDLYFSSDGFYNNELGYGLLDIYKVDNINAFINDYNEEIINGTLDQKAIRKKMEKKIVHLKSPFNSTKDDFAYFLDKPRGNNPSEAYAYFSSNRKHENKIHYKDDDIIDCIDDTNNDCLGIDDEIYRVLVKQNGTTPINKKIN